jgi:hypothetical protein
LHGHYKDHQQADTTPIKFNASLPQEYEKLSYLIERAPPRDLVVISCSSGSLGGGAYTEWKISVVVA